MILEGYIANWKNYPKDEVKVRVARPSVLSPSVELLKDWKDGKITWNQYEKRFRSEICSNEKAMEKLREIKRTSMKNNVRLICYEKKPPCHRFILMKMISDLPDVEVRK